jgi:ABC-type transporter Mla subunit MlaD
MWFTVAFGLVGLAAVAFAALWLAERQRRIRETAPRIVPFPRLARESAQKDVRLYEELDAEERAALQTFFK